MRLGQRPATDERFLHQAERVATRDTLDVLGRTTTIIARADEQAIGQWLDETLHRIISAIKKILQCTGQIAQVFRRAE